ncbi:S26 family signal peptidase [Kitasatospora phosalacinea]|uniref:S26 family signal peptidase n=1 Tax=Kitasatospora phosalacinea TaxID=2065 RepID=UPI003653136B
MATATAAAAAAAGAGVLLRIRRRFVVVTVEGGSMRPALSPGDVLLVRRVRVGRVRAGDVVVLGTGGSDRPPPDGPLPAGVSRAHRWIVKRAVAVPGDPVPRARVAALAHVPEAVVPPGRIVLVGDDPGSVDSKQHGYFDARRLVGVAVRPLAVQHPTGPAGRAVRTEGGPG